MTKGLPQAVLAQLDALSVDDPLLALLTISHVDLTTRRLVRNLVDVSSRGDTYTAAAFELVLPPEEEGTAGNAQLLGDAVDRSLIVDIRTIITPATVDVEFVRASDLDTVLLTWSLKTRSISYDARQVSVQLAAASILDEPFPGIRYTPARFPGLHR